MYLFNKIILIADAQVIGAGAPPPNDWLSYANFIYPFALSVAAVLALIMIIVAGLEMMTASEGMRSDAKQKIQNAILGLLLAVGTYLILNTINPDLLNLRIDTAGLKVDVNGQGNPQAVDPLAITNQGGGVAANGTTCPTLCTGGAVCGPNGTCINQVYACTDVTGRPKAGVFIGPSGLATCVAQCSSNGDSCLPNGSQIGKRQAYCVTFSNEATCALSNACKIGPGGLMNFTCVPN